MANPWDPGRIRGLVELALSLGAGPSEILSAMAEGMEEVGRRFEEGEYFLADLVMAAEAFNLGLRALKPRLEAEGLSKPIGRVVIGTVEGDIHDVGKNMVAAMLSSAGFEVIDLGANVPIDDFVEAAARDGADIVAMSALLDSNMWNMKAVIERLRERGLRDRVKVIIGGAPTNERFAMEIGADAYGRDAVEAVRKCKELLGWRT